MMKTTSLRAGSLASCTAAAWLLAAIPAQAQVGIGVAYPGVPFLYYTPQTVPSPTEYLYNVDRARVASYGNALQQQAAASAGAEASAGSNAYFHRIRDYSGEETYHVRSRQSLSRRASPSPSPLRSAAEEASPASATLKLDAFFRPDGTLDWPRDAPDSAALHSARQEAEAALRTVRDELHAAGKVKAQSVGAAKWKLVDYGQRALRQVRSERSEAISTLFHYFLLFLNQALDQAAGAGTS